MTSINQKTKALDTTDTSGDYTEFLCSVAATLSDLKERIRAQYQKTVPGGPETIELMSLDVYTGFMTLAINFGIGRSTLKLTEKSVIRSDTAATKTDSKSDQSKSATVSTSRRTGSHSNNSRTGQTKKSPKS